MIILRSNNLIQNQWKDWPCQPELQMCKFLFIQILIKTWCNSRSGQPELQICSCCSWKLIEHRWTCEPVQPTLQNAGILKELYCEINKRQGLASPSSNMVGLQWELAPNRWKSRHGQPELRHGKFWIRVIKNPWNSRPGQSELQICKFLVKI